MIITRRKHQKREVADGFTKYLFKVAVNGPKKCIWPQLVYIFTLYCLLFAGISAQMLSRITGSVLVVSGERHDLPTEQLSKINIGLNLKFNKKVRKWFDMTLTLFLCLGFRVKVVRQSEIAHFSFQPSHNAEDFNF